MGTVKGKVRAAIVNRIFGKWKEGVLHRNAASRTFYLRLKMRKNQRGAERDPREV